jgi:hypothetical protein
MRRLRSGRPTARARGPVLLRTPGRRALPLAWSGCPPEQSPSSPGTGGCSSHGSGRRCQLRAPSRGNVTRLSACSWSSAAGSGRSVTGSHFPWLDLGGSRRAAFPLATRSSSPRPARLHAGEGNGRAAPAGPERIRLLAPPKVDRAERPGLVAGGAGRYRTPGLGSVGPAADPAANAQPGRRGTT